MAKGKYGQYVSVEEFCEQLGIGRNKAYAILKDEACRAIKLGNMWFIPYDSAERYIQDKINKKLMKELWKDSADGFPEEGAEQA